MAGFHVCPMSPEVKRLFRSRPDLLMKPRIPIAERARVALNRTEGGEVLLDFEPGVRSNNNFTVSSFTRHLSGIRKNSHIKIFQGETRNGYRVIGIKVFEWEKKGPELSSPDFLLCMEYIFDPDIKNRMTLSWIKSNSPGLGGRGLVTTYNIARDNGIEFIDYYLNPERVDAKRFYYHMDWGKRAEATPRRRIGGLMEVRVI